MTTIDPARLAAVIRRQVASLGAPSKGDRVGTSSGARTAAGAAASRTARAGSASAGADDVAALVARRVQALDRDDPDRHRKAFRVFLESVLLAELGPQLVNDAGFHRLVDDVHSTMQNDRELAAQIRGATNTMLSDRR